MIVVRGQSEIKKILQDQPYSLDFIILIFNVSLQKNKKEHFKAVIENFLREEEINDAAATAFYGALFCECNLLWSERRNIKEIHRFR
jgi:hypothetical protein